MEASGDMFSTKQIATCATLGVIYITVSAAMIHSNKWMMRDDHFPYASVLCSFHMFTSGICSLACYKLFPSWYTAMATLKVDGAFVMKFVPIGIAFAASLVLSNQAYVYNNVAFIQMLKEGNIVMVFFLSVLVGLQKFSKTAATILLIVVSGSVMACYGEMHFVLLGVIVQLLSQLFEVTKILVQNMLMAARGTKLDPLTTVLFMAPICFVIVSMLSIYNHGSEIDVVVEHAAKIAPALFMNSLLAFSLNVIVAMQIWLFSGVGFLMCGMAKDICIVTVSALLMGEVISPLQLIGFTITIVGILLYSTMKMHEQLFVDDNMIAGFTRVFETIFPMTSHKTSDRQAMLGAVREEA